MSRRLMLVPLAAMLVVSVLGATPAAGKSAPPTKIRFKLDDHNVAPGEAVTSTVRVTSGRGKARGPLAGADLSVLVDGVEVASLTTDPDGIAAISYGGAAAGDHVMRVVYAGDGTHKRAKRSQGFEVGAEEALEEEA